MIPSNEPPPPRCPKVHPKKHWIRCELMSGHGWDCRGIIGVYPFRRFIEFNGVDLSDPAETGKKENLK